MPDPCPLEGFTENEEMNFFLFYAAATLYAIAAVCYLVNTKIGVIAFFTVSAAVVTMWLSWRLIAHFAFL